MYGKSEKQIFVAISFFRPGPRIKRQVEALQNSYTTTPKNKGVYKHCTKYKENTNKARKLKILHQNMDSLKNKTNRLDHLLHNTKPHIVVLTEHGLKEDQLQQTKITNYNLVGGFSRKFARKGGVAIFAHESLGNLVRSEDISTGSEELTCELYTASIERKKGKIYIVGAYRPPNGNLEDALNIISDTLDKIPTWKCPTIIIGDINVDRLVQDQNKNKLENLFANYNIERMELPATRKTHTSATSIDMVCSNLNRNDIDIEVFTTGLSDHTAQLSTVNLQLQNTTSASSTHRQFSQENLNQLRTILKNESWLNVYNTPQTDQAYDYFNNILGMALNHACPLKKSRKKRKKKFGTIIDSETQTLKNAYLQALENKILYNRNEDKIETAIRKREYDLKLKQKRKEATSAYIQNNNNKQKALWNVVNYERCKTTQEPSNPQLLINSSVVEDPFQIAQHFNQHFTTAAETAFKNAGQEHLRIENNNQPADFVPELLFLPTSVQEVVKIISSLKSKPSSGIDELSSIFLKHCKEEIALPLTSIINKSLTQGIFPSALKIAKVFPKLKKQPSNTLDNFRPISLLSTISKVIEKIVLTQLLDHLSAFNILTTQQHGFLKGRSTTSALISFTEHVLDKMEEGTAVSAFFLDFSKAFDCLSHDLLLEKIEKIGIRGVAGKWMSSYLKGRSQIVEINHTVNNTTQKIRSTPLPINTGVPQGSVLGPVLFLLLTNDLPAYLQEYCQSLMFADDTTIVVAENQETELQISSFIALNMAKQYCHQNDLILNENKTQQLNFGRISTDMPGSPDIEPKEEANYLGLTIDNKLTWTTHIDNLCKKLNSSLYVLKRIKDISTPDTVRTTYFSLFESYLRYGLVVWGYSSIGNLQRVMTIQKKAIRTMADMDPLATCRSAFQELKILTVASLFVSEVICYAISKNITRMGQIHNYNTRNTINFSLPVHHLSSYEKKPSYIGPKLFNLLPDHLKRISGEKHFKKILQDWLLTKSFYSIDEFVNWNNN